MGADSVNYRAYSSAHTVFLVSLGSLQSYKKFRVRLTDTCVPLLQYLLPSEHMASKSTSQLAAFHDKKKALFSESRERAETTMRNGFAEM